MTTSSSSWVKATARTLALWVEDESMVGRHSGPGDVVVLEHGRSPRPGEVAAALVIQGVMVRLVRG